MFGWEMSRSIAHMHVPMPMTRNGWRTRDSGRNHGTMLLKQCSTLQVKPGIVARKLRSVNYSTVSILATWPSKLHSLTQDVLRYDVFKMVLVRMVYCDDSVGMIISNLFFLLDTAPLITCFHFKNYHWHLSNDL